MPAILEKTNTIEPTLQKLATNIAISINELTAIFKTPPTRVAKIEF